MNVEYYTKYKLILSTCVKLHITSLLSRSANLGSAAIHKVEKS